MALSFPVSPSIGDTHTVGTRSWHWDGSIWAALTGPYNEEGEFYGAKVTSLVNYVNTNGDALVFDSVLTDSGSFTNLGTHASRITIQRTGWYWVGANITTLGTDYSGSNNSNVSISIVKNWDGVSAYLDSTIAFERFENGLSTSAQANSILQQVYLTSGDYVEVITYSSVGSDLLIESNPSDGSPGGYPTDAGLGTLSPHFFIQWIGGFGPRGVTGATGAAGADGQVVTVTAGTGISVDSTDPANPVVSTSATGSLITENIYTTSATYSTSSGSIADVDSTNLSVTFTVPASGKVLVVLSAYVEGASSVFGLRQSTTTIAESSGLGADGEFKSARLYVDGLTPSASLTWKFAWYRLSSGTASIYGGGNAGVPQPITMEVFSR
jgi:hypothetical protein